MARTLLIFDPRSNAPPSTLAATPLVRTSGASPVQQVDTLMFAAAGSAYADFYSRMPIDYGGGDIEVHISWMGATATTGVVRWLIAWQRHQDDTDDMDAVTFATAKALDATTASATGEKAYDSITFSNAEADGVLAGEDFCVRVQREGDHANDTMTGFAQLCMTEIRES